MSKFYRRLEIIVMHFVARSFCVKIKTERSDATILGTLGILAHFRHFPVYAD